MRPAEMQFDAVFTTDIATIGLQFEGSRLTRLAYLTDKNHETANSKPAEQVINQIRDYLSSACSPKIFDIDILLKVTAFQHSVLAQLQLIPYGETRTYGDIANILKTSPRAVGNACRNNPIAIIIPCHRVVAANHIGGYDGATTGGLIDIKHQLLKIEGAIS